MRISGAILAATLIAAGPNTSGTGSVLTLLCNGQGHVYIDAAQYVYLRKATLRGDYFTGWIELGIERGFVRRHPLASLKNRWGLAYQLDTSDLTTVHPLVASNDMIIALAFPRLKAGAHRLRLGLLDPKGNLTQEDAYCFSTPSRFVLADPTQRE
jgi:hypothetical protein